MSITLNHYCSAIEGRKMVPGGVVSFVMAIVNIFAAYEHILLVALLLVGLSIPLLLVVYGKSEHGFYSTIIFLFIQMSSDEFILS